MNKNIFSIKNLIVVLAITPSFLVAQSKRDSISTRVVDVVKSYAPTIAEAYKKREDANLKGDSLTITKKNINYSIYSVPMASTFVPEKGKATMMKKTTRAERYIDSYVGGGFGMLNTLYADASITLPVNKESNIGFIFNHLSSNSSVKNVIPDNDYAHTSAQLRYDFLNTDVNWGIHTDFGRRFHQFYGIQKGLYTDKKLQDLTGLKQAYFDYGAGGYLRLSTPYFKGLDFSFTGLYDSFDSSETNVRIVPTAEFELDNDGHKIRANFIFDYYASNFKRNEVFSPSQIRNKWMLFALNPYYYFSVDDIDLKLGASVVYAGGNDNYKNEFKAYPDVEVSYKLSENNTILHSGVRGMLQQNTFASLTKNNPYLAPTQYILPTSVAVDIFAGIKGELSTSLFYSLKGSYRQFENLPLFTTLTENGTASLTMAYQHNNAFRLVYDKVNHFELAVGMDGNINDIFFFDFEGKFNAYKTKSQAEAWNLPQITAHLFTDFQIIRNLKAGIDAFYVGDRSEMDYATAMTSPNKISLKGYFDMNLHTDYTYDNQWIFFIKANNLLSDNYERFAYYPVHGLQILGGVKYLFSLKKK